MEKLKKEIIVKIEDSENHMSVAKELQQICNEAAKNFEDNE